MAGHKDTQTLESKVPENCQRIIGVGMVKFCFAYLQNPPTPETKCPCLGTLSNYHQGARVYYCTPHKAI